MHVGKAFAQEKAIRMDIVGPFLSQMKSGSPVCCAHVSLVYEDNWNVQGLE